MSSILNNIGSPADVRKLDMAGLKTLCDEIRHYIIECCATNPGHLGSSLGAVELIVALHYVFNTPDDKIIFDVGHQAYAHKIITGRREAFRLNRRHGGISGFPRMEESPYDAFGAGHSSTSISAALGFAEAAKLRGETFRTVAVIGDGALTGGLAWEGLNNAGGSNADILIVLNDNNISIDDNIGAVHNYLLRITTDPFYNKVKRHIWNRLGDRRLRSWIRKGVIDIKSNLVRSYGGALFEALGFRYFGPVNGNDVEQMTEVLERLRSIKGPRILHCMTKKGKGFAPAEADPTVWHAPGRYDPVSGERPAVKYAADRYQDVFGHVLLELARMDPAVVGVTPAMAMGCGMNIMQKEMPDRVFDVGIEEEHAVTFSAGLAAGGMKPFCNIYSSFSQRAYDQIIHDVALQNLPVTLCLDRAGLVGEDGATHHGCFDMAAYRSIPNAIIASPRNETELKNLMYSALGLSGGPYIIRYPRGLGEGDGWKGRPFRTLPFGKGEMLEDGTGAAVLTIGPVANRVLEAAARYREKYGTGPRIYDMRFLKPLDEGILEEAAGQFRAVLTVEDGALKGGLFGAVAEYMAEHGHRIRLSGKGIPDRFIAQGTTAEEWQDCGMDGESIFAEIEKLMSF